VRTQTHLMNIHFELPALKMRPALVPEAFDEPRLVLGRARAQGRALDADTVVEEFEDVDFGNLGT
jgi:hypothetical protein